MTRRPEKVAELAVRSLADGEVVVLRPDGSAALVLNGTGAAVLELCDGRHSVVEMATLIASVFPEVPREAVEADVDALVAQLTDAGCLR